MADDPTAAQPETRRPPSEGAAPPSPHLKAVEEALVALRRSSKDLSFYPAGHPALQKSLERTTAQLYKVIETENPISLTIARESIAHHLGEVGKSNATVKSFAAELFTAQVRRLHFGANFTPDELMAFLSMVTRDPKKILLEGGPEAILNTAGVHNIQVNQLRFHPAGGEGQEEGGVGIGAGGMDLVEAIAPAQGEELKEAPAQSADQALDDVGEMIGGTIEKVDILLQAANAPVVIEEEAISLEELLFRMETAGGLEYQRLGRRLDGVARNALAYGRADQLVLMATTMARHRDDPARSDDIRQVAARFLDGMLEAGALEFLVDRLCQKGVGEGEEITELLGNLGERAVEAMLQRLILEENMLARRRLLDAIVQQGEMALPAVLRGLADERWFVLRNMAIILAELGHESSVEPLGQQLRHPDRRVRREVARAIAKIGGRQAPRLLRERLTDSDPVVCRQAIMFLGTMRDPRAIPPLLAVAQGRARDRDEQEMRKAAIQALGQIGTQVAVPVLAQVVRRRSLFRRAEPDEIRIAAAMALGQMGGARARIALERAKASGGRVGEACQQALERLGPS